MHSSQSNNVFGAAVHRRGNFGAIEQGDEEIEGDLLEWRGPEPGAAYLASALGDDGGRGAPHRARSARIHIPPETRIPEERFPKGEIRVARDTDVNLAGAAIAGTLRKDKECSVLASGREAVNQATKSLAMANRYIRDRKEGQAWFQSNHLYR